MSAVIRPSWKPTEEDLAAVEEARKAWAAVEAAEETAWQKTQALRDRKIPDLSICELLPRVSRSTLNRRLGPRKDRE